MGTDNQYTITRLKEEEGLYTRIRKISQVKNIKGIIDFPISHPILEIKINVAVDNNAVFHGYTV